MRSWILLFACNLMWALQFTCIKLVQDQVGPVFTVWAPMSIATILLYPFIRAERNETTERSRLTRTDILRYFLLAILGVFPAQVMMTWGTRMSLASNAALLSLTTPVCTALFAFLFLKERMTLVRWISFLLAIAGVLLCSGLDFHSLNFGGSYLVGNSLIFAATLGSSFYNSYGKKMLERHSPTEMLFYTYVAVLLLITPVVLAEEGGVLGRMGTFTVRTWIGLSLLTFFHNYLSMVLFLKALKQLDAMQAALSFYLVTFFGIPIATFTLGEKLTAAAIAGGVLILGSTILITVWEERRAARPQLAPAVDP